MRNPPSYRESQVSIDLLRARVDYNPFTGAFRWREHCEPKFFPSLRGYRVWHAQNAGKPILTRDSNGYTKIRISSLEGVKLALWGHRVAWALMTGEWPKDKIDHRDRDTTNNVWSNLRQADDELNAWNRSMMSNNTSGHKGVHRHSQNGYWVAQIRVGGKTKHLGCFGEDFDAACAAYAQAERALHGEFSPQMKEQA